LAFHLIPFLAFSQEVSEVINNSYFGVPSSPAFEFLPDKASEVTHVLTGKDIGASIPTVFDGNSLKPGFAIDMRPGSYAVGSLEQYRQNRFKRVLWRLVLSLGSSGIEDSKDTYLAVGLRVPIIDLGDARIYSNYLDDLETATINALEDQPSWPDDPKKLIDEMEFKTTQAQKEIRDKFIEDHWNAMRVEIGLANMFRLKNSKLKSDSINQDRIGLWVAGNFPLGNKASIIISGKNSWINTTGNSESTTISKDSLETSRSSLGARLRFFFSFSKVVFALSGEYAFINSAYENMNSLNENWHHLGLLLEIPVLKLNSFIGIAYGGDTGRREDVDSKFEVKYSIYADKLIKKNP
jgi:hypothetical protein